MPPWPGEGSATEPVPATNDHPRAAPVGAGRPSLDSAGRYHDRGRFSALVLGVYGFLAIVIVVALRDEFGTSSAWVPIALLVAIAFLVVRYLSTGYRIDDEYLRARRILGGQKLRLDQVRRIEYAALRDLSPTGFFGSWGWRGRMWSPVLGRFDAVYTEPAGLLVTAGDIPLFISPRDLPGFARELSRRVRSYTGRLTVDVGDPTQVEPVPAF